MSLLSLGQVWATDYELMLTLDVASGAPGGTTSTAFTDDATLLSYLQAAAPASTDITAASKVSGDVYKGKGSGGGDIPQACLKLGKASGPGSISFTIASTYDDVTKVEITGYGWKTSTAVAVNSSETQSPAVAKSQVYTFSYEISATKTITIAVTSSAFCATAIKLYRTSTGGTPTCATPTFDPASGELFSDDIDVEIACATEGATIYYTTDGNDPTTSSNVYSTALNFTETTTLKAMAVKAGSNNSAIATATYTKMTPVPGYEIDFESDLAAYVDWNFVNLTKFNETITAHEGTYFAKTNGTNTASITTKAKVANPGTLTYYISKIGTNTNANSKWKARVSEDGTSWTIVGTEYGAGAGVTAGTWNECTADLSAYSDVYVQVYYDGTTAVRTIDDISLTTATPSSVETPTFSPVAGTYTSVQSVELSCATDGATIYYTTNGDTPDNTSTPYTSAISVGETMTIKAIAIKESESSAVATATYTINLPLSTMDQIFAAATAAGSTATDVNITFGSWVVSGVSTNGKNVFVTDGTKGFVVFDNGGSMGFAVGDVLSGTAACKVQLYKGAAELTLLTSTTEGLSVATGGSVTPEVKAISALGGINTGAPVTINSVQFDGEYLSDGANSIKPYNSLFAYEALENGKYYNVTGIYQQFGNTTKEILPRSAADIEELTLADPELSYSPASETIEVGDSWSAPTFNNEHGLTVSFSGDNDAVATVNTTTGEIALAGGTGTAVITASFAGNATYAAGNATYTITVSAADSRKSAVGPAEFTTTSGFLTPSDILYISHKGGASTAPGNYNSGIRLYQISGTNTYGGYVTLIAKKGCKIDEVEITTTSKYATTVGYYVDAAEAAIQGSADVAKSGTYNTATGLNADSVRILNLGTGSNGRLEIASITVYYTGDAAAVDHYELGGSYQTEFEIDDAFNHDGLSVYMAYDAGGTEKLDLTAGCTFSEPDMTAAGTPTVEISFGTTVITSYDITVAASTLLDPELSYDPTSVTLTQGDALSAPTFNNPHTLSPITYKSSKTAVATVDEFGVITLAGGTGTATITASFAGDATYQAGNATFTITVNEPEEDLTGTWEFATSVAAGDRIIIASIADAGAVTTMGAQNGNNRSGVASTVAGTELTPAAGTKSVTLVDAGEGKFALQLNNGSYLYAASNTNNYLKETAAYADNENAKWTIAFDGEGVATITAQGTNSHNVMRYNPNSGSPLFACYTNVSTTGTLVTIYKKVVPVVTPETVRTGLEINRYYTVCLPKKITSVTGGTFWTLTYKDAEPATMVYIEEATPPFAAGKPYIFQATATSLQVVCEGDATDVAGTNGALVGTLADLDAAALAAKEGTIYLLIQNALRPNDNNYLSANRAYIRYDLLTVGTPVPAPGKRVRTMPLQGQTITGIDELNTSETPAKLMINGQLFILRGEKMYDAQGRLVK